MLSPFAKALLVLTSLAPILLVFGATRISSSLLPSLTCAVTAGALLMLCSGLLEPPLRHRTERKLAQRISAAKGLMRSSKALRVERELKELPSDDSVSGTIRFSHVRRR